MNAHTTRTDFVLTDQASADMALRLYERLVREDEALSKQPTLLVLHDMTWEMTPKSLDRLYGGICEHDQAALMVVDHMAWIAMGEYTYDPSDAGNKRDFRESSTQVFAENIAMRVVAYDGREFEECPLIVVHSDTAQQGGFIPLVRAIRETQSQERRQPVRAYVHDGTLGSCRLFEEFPVTTRKV